MYDKYKLLVSFNKMQGYKAGTAKMCTVRNPALCMEIMAWCT